MQASCSRIDAARWHFQHGPIDLIITVDGKADAIARALDSAWSRFQQLLPELVDELVLLRQAVRSDWAFKGAVAKRMQAACWPHRAQFITPMAAVAGSVADEMIEFFSCEPDIQRAAINNGGDIALHLQANASYRIGLLPISPNSVRSQTWSPTVLLFAQPIRCAASRQVGGGVAV